MTPSLPYTARCGSLQIGNDSRPSVGKTGASLRNAKLLQAPDSGVPVNLPLLLQRAIAARLMHCYNYLQDFDPTQKVTCGNEAEEIVRKTGAPFLRWYPLSPRDGSVMLDGDLRKLGSSHCKRIYALKRGIAINNETVPNGSC